MKKTPVMVLRFLVLLVAIVALAFLLGMPHVEGRNVNATWFEIYFRDGFLAYVYLGSIAFFVGLSRLYVLLGYAKEGALLSAQSLKAVQLLRCCALICIAFIIGGQLFLLMQVSDDRAGGIMMGNVILLGSVLTAFFAWRAERRWLQVKSD